MPLFALVALSCKTMCSINEILAYFDNQQQLTICYLKGLPVRLKY
jgi:hypothetical protein